MQRGRCLYNATSYRQARRALVNLGGNADILDRFKVLRQEDIKMSGDMLEENRVGQRSHKLPWIWRMKDRNNTGDNDWMQEGKSFSYSNSWKILLLYSVSCKLVPWQGQI
jgi:hypothetical protein